MLTVWHLMSIEEGAALSGGNMMRSIVGFADEPHATNTASSANNLMILKKSNVSTYRVRQHTNDIILTQTATLLFGCVQMRRLTSCC